MTKQSLFESFNDKSYENTTDPFGSILEGPKFSFGDAPSINGDYEEDGSIGKENEGEFSKSTHTLTPEEEEAAREEGNKEDGIIPQDDEPSELETEADRILASSNAFDAEGGMNYTDALDYAKPLGDNEDAIIDPSYGISGEREPSDTFEMEPLPLDEPGNPLQDEVELGSEDVLSAPEEPVTEEPLEATTADRIALSNVSVEELLKELQFRLANKEV